jgi:hypothetical protein
MNIFILQSNVSRCLKDSRRLINAFSNLNGIKLDFLYYLKLDY